MFDILLHESCWKNQGLGGPNGAWCFYLRLKPESERKKCPFSRLHTGERPSLVAPAPDAETEIAIELCEEAGIELSASDKLDIGRLKTLLRSHHRENKDL
jgi:hypothetical protein